MSAQMISANTLHPSDSSLDCFNIVLLYQNQDTAVRGMQLCENLAAGLGKSIQLNKVMWKFDLLDLPKMRELANDDASGADMIIFAMAQNTELPTSICAWIEDGLTPASEKSRALVALFLQESETFVNASLDYLRKLAETRKFDFFSNAEGDEISNSYALPV